MELKEGMYVRTKITDNCNCIYIRKITEIDVENPFLNQIGIDEDVIDGWGDDRICIDVEDISKASYSLLGNDKEPCLIEVGDYVNGYKITTIGKNGIYAEDEQGYLIKMFDEKDIKSIVTKEQFECVSYEVVSK